MTDFTETTDAADVWDDRAFRPHPLAPGGRVYGPLMAAALGGVTLLDPHLGSAERRAGVHRAVAAVSGVYGGAELGEALTQGLLARGRPQGIRFQAARAAVALAGGAAVAGVSLAAAPLNDRVDGLLVRGLQRLGVRRPRWALAGASAATVLAGNIADRANRQRILAEDWATAGTGPSADPGLALTDIPADAYEVLAALLAPAAAEGAELPGAEALRAQLIHTRSVDEGTHITFTDWLTLVVDETADLEQAVPHAFTWPVRARFTHDGEEFELTLRVAGGELTALVLEPVDETRDEAWEARATIGGWPHPAELELRVDSAAGPRAV